MTDFYEELNLNPQDSVADINRALTQLESTWKRREINSPEKATKMLALILEARNAFKSDATKAEYDHNLAESKKAPEQVDYGAERKVQFQQYRTQAEKLPVSCVRSSVLWRGSRMIRCLVPMAAPDLLLLF